MSGRGAANDGGRGRVCFSAPHLYPVTSRGEVPFAGGAEVQQWMLARGIAGCGFDVSIATCDYGQPERVVRDGVTLLRTYRPAAGPPVVRFFHPRLTKTIAALRRADAEVYFVQGSGMHAGLAFDVARMRGAGFVFLGAHDFDALKTLPFQTNARDRWWYRRALFGADARVAQTEAQRRLFRENFGLECQVITNPVIPPAEPADAGQEGTIVWLATYKPSKRPEWFVELARKLPRYRFVMYGVIPPPPEHSQWEEATRAAASCPNLEVRGFVDHDRLAEVFRAASLFVHTSPAEGFPNVVLEAWSWGIPTVTVVDPDGVARRERLGAVVEDHAGLVAAVERLMTNPAERRSTGERARAYVEAHHAPGPIYAQLAGVFDRVVTRVRGRRGR